MANSALNMVLQHNETTNSNLENQTNENNKEIINDIINDFTNNSNIDNKRGLLIYKGDSIQITEIDDLDNLTWLINNSSKIVKFYNDYTEHIKVIERINKMVKELNFIEKIIYKRRIKLLKEYEKTIKMTIGDINSTFE